MKHAMKKIMGLLLVAVLLVSVVPFQAFAMEDADCIRVQYKINGEKQGDLVRLQPDEGEMTVADAVKFFQGTGANLDKYTAYLYPAVGKNHAVEADDIVKKGDGLHINFEAAEGFTPSDPSDGGMTGSTPSDGGMTSSTPSNGGMTGSQEPETPATKPAVKAITFDVKIDDKVVAEDLENVPSNGVSSKASDLLTYVWKKGWDKDYKIEKVYDNATKATLADGDCAIAAGSDVIIRITAKNASTKPTDPKPTEPTAEAIKVVVKLNNSNNVIHSFEKVPANGESAKVGDLLTYGWNKDWDNVYTFDYAWSNAQQKELTKSGSVKAGDTLYIMLKNSDNGNGSGNGNGSSSNKFPYKVYLHVYLNNNIGEPDRNINITNTLAVDGVVSMSEVKNLIPDFYKAKNSNGIGYDGLYLAKGNWVKDYVTDSNKYAKLTDIDVRTGEEYVHINVMITNAVAKTSSNADTSNPKTGDAIFMTITVMGLSAAALTALYVYDKKRAVK